MRYSSYARLLACWALAAVPAASAITIDLDYTYDTNDFFSGPNIGRRTYLQAAAQTLSSHLSDSLLAITPSGQNTWSEQFLNPSTGATTTLLNPTVPANTIVIYVGGQNLSGGTLGEGGPGGDSISGTQTFLNTVQARGQSGALASTATDFGPWGGSVTFDLGANWYFDPDPSTMESIGTKDDFYSVALHEIGHVLGLGTADSWMAKISGQTFIGTHAEAAYGGPVPLDSGLAHWAEGDLSLVPGTTTEQPACLTPALTEGTRNYFTQLDYAGLSDVGWQVVGIPEPASGSLLLLGGLLACRRRRPLTD